MILARLPEILLARLRGAERAVWVGGEDMAASCTTRAEAGGFGVPVSQDYWQVLHVAANHEKRVAQHLQVRALEYYLPLYSERSRWSDRTVLLERPLFAGYVFVRIPPRARIAAISTPGVLRLLGDDQRCLVSAAEIERIREGLRSGCLLRPHPGLAVGTRVRVCRGVFEGAVGRVTEFRRQCKVILSLSGVQQCFTLELDLSDVEVLPAAAGDTRPQPRRAQADGAPA